MPYLLFLNCINSEVAVGCFMAIVAATFLGWLLGLGTGLRMDPLSSTAALGCCPSSLANACRLLALFPAGHATSLFSCCTS